MPYWIDRIWTLAQVGVVAKRPRKEIREDHQTPSALGHGVLASLDTDQGQSVNRI
jgi:hypothetical protein